MAIVVRRSFAVPPPALAAASCAALDAPLGDEAELWLGRPASEAVALGAFQRALAAEGLAPEAPLLRRGSGGPRVRMGEGTLWLALLLPRASALVACDESRLVNRYARPLLRALTRCGAPAHFFGRDWVSVGHRPAAWIGFAHDQQSGRVVIEAFVAVSTPFAAGERASYLGKPPGTIEEIAGRKLDVTRLADAVVEAYAAAYGRAAIDGGELPPFAPSPPVPSEPPWRATREAPIGPLGAGPDAEGRFRVGGDLLVSRDALTALERALASTSDDDVARAVDASLGAPGIALDGVGDLTVVRDVILAARPYRN
jgi:hypothetical protein